MKRVRPGQKLSGLSAGDWNAFAEAVEWIRQFQNQRELPSATPRAGIVQVKNVDSVGFNQFDVVGLDDIFAGPDDNLDEFKANPSFKAKKPEGKTCRSFAILQEPIASGTDRVAAAVVSGVTICRIHVRNANDSFARVKLGDANQLESTDCGPAAILWKQSGTGENKWAVVNLGVSCGDCGSSSSSSSSTSSSSTSSTPSSSSVSSSSISSSSASGSSASSSSLGSSSSSSSSSSSPSSSSCSGPCSEIEVVTDVQCVNGNIVVTKKKLRICGTNVCVEVI